MTTSVSSRSSTLGELRVGHDRLTFKLTSEQSEGVLTVVDVTIPPGGGPPMLHRHDPFELYRVRSGELAVYLEGDDRAVTRMVAGPGTLVVIPSRREHTVRNESNEEVEATVVFSPGERMERFARAAAALADDRTPGPDEVFALAEAHGIEITRSIQDVLSRPEEKPSGGVARGGAGYGSDGTRTRDLRRDRPVLVVGG